eukprot:SAG31_NODE_227_length_19818_cov_6.503271_11_plen_93_part_00
MNRKRIDGCRVSAIPWRLLGRGANQPAAPQQRRDELCASLVPLGKIGTASPLALLLQKLAVPFFARAIVYAASMTAAAYDGAGMPGAANGSY